MPAPHKDRLSTVAHKDNGINELPLDDRPGAYNSDSATLSLTLEWMQGLLATDDGVANEAIKDSEFWAELKRACSALAGGAPEAAESAVEFAIKRFAEIQNRAFLNRRARELSPIAEINALTELKCRIQGEPAVCLERAAELCQISTRTVYRKLGKFEVWRKYRHIYISVRSIIRFIAEERYEGNKHYDFTRSLKY